jgi:5-methyltetrahydrofolate--homocysteine methyltransferase
MDLNKTFEAVIGGDLEGVEKGVESALADGVKASEILNKALIAAMTEVGTRFEAGDFFVPEMLISARAMQSGMRLIKPHLVADGVPAVGKIAIGTVKGDLHDIGKNLVGMMLEGAGYEIIDLGVDAEPEKFVEAAKDGADLIGMSALLTTTMGSMEDTINALKEAGLREKVKVIIGGAPVTDEFAKEIGADAFAADASTATRVTRELLS